MQNSLKIKKNQLTIVFIGRFVEQNLFLKKQIY